MSVRIGGNECYIEFSDNEVLLTRKKSTWDDEPISVTLSHDDLMTLDQLLETHLSKSQVIFRPPINNSLVDLSPNGVTFIREACLPKRCSEESS